jgi:hypothetical protein
VPPSSDISIVSGAQDIPRPVLPTYVYSPAEVKGRRYLLTAQPPQAHKTI